MARTRKIDAIDEAILGILSGERKNTDQSYTYWSDSDKEAGEKQYYSTGGDNVDHIWMDLNAETGQVHKKATIRYRLGKLVDMGRIDRRGICGWGRSYIYVYVTDAERQEKARKQANARFRADFTEDIKAMLASVGIRVAEYESVDEHGDIVVNASDLARVLRENYSFETVYEGERENQSA
jgi:predicted transcriptional regulator